MNTVGELRAAISGLPDDTPLAISTEEWAPLHAAGEWSVDIDSDCGVSVYAEGSASSKPLRVRCLCGLIFTVRDTNTVASPTERVAADEKGHENG